MESHSDSYNDKYFKTEGTVELIDEEGAYLIRYLSTVENHMRMYKAWIVTDDLSCVSEGENIFVVAQYVGFAEGSEVPTFSQYKLDKSANTFYSVLSKKVKIINKDVSFDNLLRYGQYQEYVYTEGTVTAVFESCLNIVDAYGNNYIIYDGRVDKSVVLQGDYIKVWGQFEGIDKAGYVWPEIVWLVDGAQ